MKKRFCIILLLALVLTGCSEPPVVFEPEPSVSIAPVETDINVDIIPGLPEEFIRGVDISTILAQEKSGVTYYDKEGREADIFRVLADAGVNYVRVRVWNDPYDADGNGYGGGNCDLENAAEIGKRAAQYGMQLCVDFHYSDFWADPSSQKAPKAWEGFSLQEKMDAISAFTTESLQTLLDRGALVGMVQLGNEINNGLCGETEIANVMDLLYSASGAVRALSPDIRIAVHYTDIHKEDFLWYGEQLDAYGIDYDVFGVSYYPYWHGSLENLTNTLQELQARFERDTVVLETSYLYTTEDGDGYPNNAGASQLVEGYPATVQGQATFIRDVLAAVQDGYGLGIFYWEPAWIPVGASQDANAQLWEQFGSGWASSFAAGYDPDNAGKYYGGSGWDNQALFDFTGRPLASLYVYRYVYTGSVGVTG